MLVLLRHEREEIVIDDRIVITVVRIQHGKVRIGVDAPREMSVDRREVHERKKREAENAVPKVSVSP